MVLIIKKITGKRCDIILIPKGPINDMLERHVDRIGLAVGRANTCIVQYHNQWTGIPSHTSVIRLLLETLENHRIFEGENRYPIPHHLFNSLRCRDFDDKNNILSEVFDGDFQINFIRIEGRGDKAVQEARRYEKIGLIESIKIKNTFKKVYGLCEKELIFLAHHIHPARRR